MKRITIFWKVTIMMAGVCLLIGPALVTMVYAQPPFTDLFSQIPSSFSSSSLLTTPRDQSKLPIDLLPSDRCPDGYYFNPKTRQCVPIQSKHTPGGTQNCPDGYYYDPMRRQCMPKTPKPMAVPMAEQG